MFKIKELKKITTAKEFCFSFKTSSLPVLLLGLIASPVTVPQGAFAQTFKVDTSLSPIKESSSTRNKSISQRAFDFHIRVTATEGTIPPEIELYLFDEQQPRKASEQSGNEAVSWKGQKQTATFFYFFLAWETISGEKWSRLYMANLPKAEKANTRDFREKLRLDITTARPIKINGQSDIEVLAESLSNKPFLCDSLELLRPSEVASVSLQGKGTIKTQKKLVFTDSYPLRLLIPPKSSTRFELTLRDLGLSKDTPHPIAVRLSCTEEGESQHFMALSSIETKTSKSKFLALYFLAVVCLLILPSLISQVFNATKKRKK